MREGFGPGASAGGVVWHDEHCVARARHRDERRARGGGALRGGAARQRLIAERGLRAEQHLGRVHVGARARAGDVCARSARRCASVCAAPRLRALLAARLGGGLTRALFAARLVGGALACTLIAASASSAARARARCLQLAESF